MKKITCNFCKKNEVPPMSNMCPPCESQINDVNWFNMEKHPSDYLVHNTYRPSEAQILAKKIRKAWDKNYNEDVEFLMTQARYIQAMNDSRRGI